MTRLSVQFEVSGYSISVEGRSDPYIVSARDVEAAPKKLRDWAARYDTAVQRNDKDALLAIGGEMFQWLDGAGHAHYWTASGGNFELEIWVEGFDRQEELALLDAPWELLAQGERHLQGDPVSLYLPWRRISINNGQRNPRLPEFGDARLLFMGAVPVGQEPLALEEEEAVIAQATQNQPIKLVVEDSGILEELGFRFAERPVAEILHLSCHGGIKDETGPFLLMENTQGDPVEVIPGQLLFQMGERGPLLAVLSACRSAERWDGRIEDRTDRSGAEVSGSFARTLSNIVPNVVGWDGSVYDNDAIMFSSTFYDWIARGNTPQWAAARARQVLLSKNSTQWHLARVYAGPGGGGAIVYTGNNQRPKGLGNTYLPQIGPYPVANRASFRGRRDKMQAALPKLRPGLSPGLIVWGLGGAGKSSIVARLADRLPQQAIQISAEDGLKDVLNKLLEAIPHDRRTPLLGYWTDTQKLEAQFEEAFREALLALNESNRAVLLIIDALDKLLEPQGGTENLAMIKRTLPRERTLLVAILRAFLEPRIRGRSSLVITSRFDFRLLDKVEDVAASLNRLQLDAMSPYECRAQLRAAAWVQGRELPSKGTVEWKQYERALICSRGNPFLQDTLTKPMLAGKLELAEKNLVKLEEYFAELSQGTLPPGDDAALSEGLDNIVLDALNRTSLGNYIQALDSEDKRQLSAASIFEDFTSVAFPIGAFEAAGSTLGVTDPRASIERLLALALMEHCDPVEGVKHVAASSLALALVPKIEGEELVAAASAALDALRKANHEIHGIDPVDRTAKAIQALALISRAKGPALIDSVNAAMLSKRGFPQDDGAVAKLAADVVPRLGSDFDRGSENLVPKEAALLLELIDAAEWDGEIDSVRQHIASGLVNFGQDPFVEASLLLRRARRREVEGLYRDAMDDALRAAGTFKNCGSNIDEAVANCQIANLHHVLGQHAIALEVLERKVLPVCAQIGDASRPIEALTRLTDSLLAKNLVEKSRRMSHRESLKVMSRFSATYASAVVRSQMAAILDDAGEAETALRILREKVVPVIRDFGRSREWAITQGRIADAIVASGTTAGEKPRAAVDDPLEILTTEVLPVFSAMNDRYSVGVAQSRVADILEERGEATEAERLRREQVLPVLDCWENRHGAAIVRCQMAQAAATSAAASGDVAQSAQALADWQNQLTVLADVGDGPSQAVVMSLIAQHLEREGRAEEAQSYRIQTAQVASQVGAGSNPLTLRGSAAAVLQSGGLDQGRIQQLIDSLWEAFQIAKEAKLGSILPQIGGHLAKILTLRGLRSEARVVLDESPATDTASSSPGPDGLSMDSNDAPMVKSLRDEVEVLLNTVAKPSPAAERKI